MYIYLILPVPSQYRCKNTTEHLQLNKQFGTFKQILDFFFVNVYLIKPTNKR